MRSDDAAEADAPIEAVLWSVIEQAIGPAHRTINEGITRRLATSMRDAVPLETPARTGESDEQLNKRSRDAVPPETPASTGESPEVPPERASLDAAISEWVCG